MNPEAYRHILVASIAGGLAGALVMWNRTRSQTAGENKLRQLAVLIVGTVASVCAVHIPLNIYPVLHLRYVTWRLEGYVARMRAGKDAELAGCGERPDRIPVGNRTPVPRRA
jgi:hypothetical protein